MLKFGMDLYNSFNIKSSQHTTHSAPHMHIPVIIFCNFCIKSGFCKADNNSGDDRIKFIISLDGGGKEEGGETGGEVEEDALRVGSDELLTDRAGAEC